ncbi:hypothetical protein R1sor_022447 [Riccia sorocarpa]|uniref:Uncharacterized protein n=1 Tax=Riccia sorocarpa TaxID=122646 RepID=A0ABD3GLE2_9MARC
MATTPEAVSDEEFNGKEQTSEGEAQSEEESKKGEEKNEEKNEKEEKQQTKGRNGADSSQWRQYIMNTSVYPRKQEQLQEETAKHP